MTATRRKALFARSTESFIGLLPDPVEWRADGQGPERVRLDTRRARGRFPDGQSGFLLGVGRLYRDFRVPLQSVLRRPISEEQQSQQQCRQDYEECHDERTVLRPA